MWYPTLSRIHQPAYSSLYMFVQHLIYTNQQEDYPGTVVTEMATDLFSSKYSQYQLSEAESVENSINRNVTSCN